MRHSPARQRLAIITVMQWDTSIAIAHSAFQISETCNRYSQALSDQDNEIAESLERWNDNKRTALWFVLFVYSQRAGQWLKLQTRVSDLL
jgi:hypothetical protein